MSNGDQSVYVTAKCPKCGTQNQLTISSGSDEQTVSCSHCRVQLGYVGELAAGPDRATPPVAPAALAAHENVEAIE